jgi:hypothetical protein
LRVKVQLRESSPIAAAKLNHHWLRRKARPTLS